jgi:N-methylhydantoinase A
MRIAFDTGGTFTDCVYRSSEGLAVLKVRSSPRDPSKAVRTALGRILATRADSPAQTRSHTPVKPSPLVLVCGTTVATNALLERRGGRATLITTAGFEDVLEIGRQARPSLYDFDVHRPEPLIPRRRRIGAKERVIPGGTILQPLTAGELARIRRVVIRARPEAVAVCLLFSFANRKHERAIARMLRREGILACASADLLPEFREFERTSTTALNAWLIPVMTRYLAGMDRTTRRITRAGAERGAPGGATRVQIMQSSGGIISAMSAAREPVRTVLSGPAGGLLGAVAAARRAGFERVLTFDMGGTSTDVSLVSRVPTLTAESLVAGVPVAIPMLDIHTVGAGGGSIARFDHGGALRVGPQSAGSEPGPACYGRGHLPTVTDAHLILGRLAPEGLLGGGLPLDAERTRDAFHRAVVGRTPRLSLERYAQAILEVAGAMMEKAIRVISVERGHDPRDFTLVAFGGAGPLHACDLASALEIPRVLIPKFPGALSALGIYYANVVKDYSQTSLFPASAPQTPNRIRAIFARLDSRACREMRTELFPKDSVKINRRVDARYAGQSWELSVPWTPDWPNTFHQLHEQRYGYANRGREVEAVTLRVRITGASPHAPERPSRVRRGSSAKAIVAWRRVWFYGSPRLTQVFDRSRLFPGNRLGGPAIISEYSATTAIPPGWSARVDRFENLLLEPPRK